MHPPELGPDWAALLDLWSGRRRGRPFPSRSDFVAEDFSPWFGDLGLLDVTEDRPARFRVRLAGTRITALDGRESTGRHLDEVVPPSLDDTLTGPLRTCAETGRPVLDAIEIEGDDVFRSVRRLILPLARPDGPADAVGLLLCALRTDPDLRDAPPRRLLHHALASCRHRQRTTVLDEPGRIAAGRW
jgi:hypothetical protein